MPDFFLLWQSIKHIVCIKLSIEHWILAVDNVMNHYNTEVDGKIRPDIIVKCSYRGIGLYMLAKYFYLHRGSQWYFVYNLLDNDTHNLLVCLHKQHSPDTEQCSSYIHQNLNIEHNTKYEALYGLYLFTIFLPIQVSLLSFLW